MNVFAPDGLVGRKEGSTWTNYTFDPQGNVVHKLSASEAITAGRLLDAWGTGVETTLPRNIDPYGYNAKWGYYYDRETALYLCQQRMYDASAGRWLNRDPIGYMGGMNLYGYCGGGPVGWADPTGPIVDSLTNYCRRFPAFCAEMAKDLGGVGVAANEIGKRFLGAVRTAADSARYNSECHFKLRTCQKLDTEDDDGLW